MKVIIAGSRTITDYEIVKTAVEKSGWLPKITMIISGCARGVDQLGLRFAKEHNITIAKFPADWDKYSVGAGKRRNIKMAQYGDKLIAIQKNFSVGTGHMVETMLDLKKDVFLTQFIFFCEEV